MFWDNELDVYQSYTYNLEFFVVNQQEAQSYLKYENQPEMLQDVVNDALSIRSTKNNYCSNWSKYRIKHS